MLFKFKGPYAADGAWRIRSHVGSSRTYQTSARKMQDYLARTSWIEVLSARISIRSTKSSVSVNFPRNSNTEKEKKLRDQSAKKLKTVFSIINEFLFSSRRSHFPLIERENIEIVYWSSNTWIFKYVSCNSLGRNFVYVGDIKSFIFVTMDQRAQSMAHLGNRKMWI